MGCCQCGRLRYFKGRIVTKNVSLYSCLYYSSLLAPKLKSLTVSHLLQLCCSDSLEIQTVCVLSVPYLSELVSGKLSADGKEEYTLSLSTCKYKGNGPEMVHMCAYCMCELYMSSQIHKSSLFIEPEITLVASCSRPDAPKRQKQNLKKVEGKRNEMGETSGEKVQRRIQLPRGA